MPVPGQLYRELFASFPTGVAVVTATGSDGRPRGLTSTSLCSVSLEPPLLLVCIEKDSATLAAIQASGSFVVNLLAAGEEELAGLFATKGAEKFEGLSFEPSAIAAGAPILPERDVAWAECVVTEAVEAGDHWVFIARMDGAAAPGGPPLLRLRRSYAPWPYP